MNNKIDISIVIPVYNASLTLKQAVQSVIDECESCNLYYEIILVNDGSTDDSLDICLDFSAKNQYIKVLSQKNAGPSAARNLGMSVANGEFIALNDSDDLWLPDKLNTQLEELNNHPEIDLLCGKYGTSHNVGRKTIVTYNKEVFHNYFSPPTCIFRRQLTSCNNVKFPENQKFSEDMRFFLDVLQYGRCVYLPKVVTSPVIKKHSFGDSGLSSHVWAMEKGELDNILYAYKINKISFITMLAAALWSFVKFIRRLFITSLIKIKKYRHTV